jgi:hypothetical protein
VVGGLAAMEVFSHQGSLGTKITLKTLSLAVQTFAAVIDPIMTRNNWNKALAASGETSQLARVST